LAPVKKLLIAMLAIAVLVITACGSSGGASGSSGGSKTLTFMVIAPPASPGNGNFPDGVNAAIDGFQAKGGIPGYKINVVWCNEGPFTTAVGTASGTAECGQKAVADHAVAVTDFSSFDTEYPYLEKDGIPVIGDVPESNGDWTNPLSYPLAGEPASTYAGAGYGMALNGCKRVALIGAGDASTGGRYMDAYQSGIKYGGSTFVGNVVWVAGTSDDLAPAVATLDTYNPDCVGTLLTATQLGPFITAVKDSGHPFIISGNQSGFPPDTIKSLGAAADGLEFTDDSLPNDWKTSGQAQMNAELSKYVPKAEIVVYTSQMWAAAEVFTQAAAAAAKTGSVTSKSVVAALNKMSNVTTGVEPPGNFSKPGALSFAQRVTVLQFAREKVVGDGQIVSIDKKLYDQAAPLVKYPVPGP
jgi:ABC-type branched-subunit amino acid transport system substrate-binding protein